MMYYSSTMQHMARPITAQAIGNLYYYRYYSDFPQRVILFLLNHATLSLRFPRTLPLRLSRYAAEDPFVLDIALMQT